MSDSDSEEEREILAAEALRAQKRSSTSSSTSSSSFSSVSSLHRQDQFARQPEVRQRGRGQQYQSQLPASPAVNSNLREASGAAGSSHIPAHASLPSQQESSSSVLQGIGWTPGPAGFPPYSGARPKHQEKVKHLQPRTHSSQVVKAKADVDRKYRGVDSPGRALSQEARFVRDHVGHVSVPGTRPVNKQSVVNERDHRVLASNYKAQLAAGAKAQPSASEALPYGKLKEWANHKITHLLLFDMHSGNHLQALFKLLQRDQLSFEEVILLLTVFSKVLTVERQKGSLRNIMQRVCESRFLSTHLKRFLSELEEKKDFPDVYSCFQKIVDLSEFIITDLKDYMYLCTDSLHQLLQIGTRLCVLGKEDQLTMKAQYLYETYVQRPDNEHVTRPSRTQRNKGEGLTVAQDYENPPDDFSELTLFPDTEEIFSPVEPFLRANKTKGAYRDLRHYLDIHTRLMRQDYLEPIRTGLRDFKQALQNERQPGGTDLRFYHHVQIVTFAASDHGVTHFITFDKSPFEHLDWAHSKRLLFGSLLVFSKDMFETTIFATVAHRDEEKLSRGVLQVVFENNLEEVFTSGEKDIFIMAETTAFFESYRHVLEGLQEFRRMPLERYIIFCSREINPPSYLQHNTDYNLAAIMQRAYDDIPIPILDHDLWPEATETTLNDSQLKAVKMALTRELALIQGPPGTGKTYVGLKIMKTLLDNNQILQSRGKSSPILVVCYTNHALDQFLEGVLDFCSDGIIRVGNRGTSTRLEKFNLNEFRKQTKMTSKTSKYLRRCKDELHYMGKKINRYWQELLKLDTVIMNVSELHEEIDMHHKESLNDPRRRISANCHAISTWLKATNISVSNHLKEAAKRHLAGVIAQQQARHSDEGLTDTLAVTKTTFFTRVKIYSNWLASYKMQLEEKITSLCTGNIQDNEEELDLCFLAQQEAYSSILPDKILLPFIKPRIFDLIKECVEIENKDIERENYVIEAWLLGTLTTTDVLLDAIEKLVNTSGNSEAKVREGKHAVMEDIDPVQERWVIEESSSEDSDPDSSLDNDHIDLDDIDVGECEMTDPVKEIESMFQASSDKEVVMLQRAKLLKIDLTDLQDKRPEWETADQISYNKVFSLYHNTVPYTSEQVSRIHDLWKLQLPDRYKLYKYWVVKRKKSLIHLLITLTSGYKDKLKEQKRARSERDIRILKKARVIGMTTTSAARLRSVLQNVRCPIIVVEEAAEVLEAHIVTTLNSHCQHLILIGDHQQLRPSPTVYKLAMECQLEISLFERLVRNGVPHVTLNEQHRMRPEICTFVRHIYPHLTDHDSVMSYPDIRGVDSNVFFLQHSYAETGVEDTMSKANLHEAKLLTKLCKYFLQQGYEANQITVLAAYSGQVGAIRDQMPLEDDYRIRVTSIDNYQGEESDIILLSLVRSNLESEVGFLKTNNRVCVALSRAKKGLFVVGNLEMLASKSKLWNQILNTARLDHVVGTSLKLVCVNHPNHITYVSHAEDFDKEVPEGGCHRPCSFDLPCGHACARMCHASDRFHEESVCQQPCRKSCPEGHPCQKQCHEECGDCQVMVSKLLPTCGHKDRTPCHQDVQEAICKQFCLKKLPCGHLCRGQCGVCLEQERHHPCLEKVDKKWPCGHTNTVQCHTQVSSEPCPTQCTGHLECGHRCMGTCGTCLSGFVHTACKAKCKDLLPCGHFCQGPCGALCVPCQERCPTRCRHGPCGQTECGRPCVPCVENCALVCRHKHCDQRCLDECNVTPCDKPCQEQVPSCKHKCWSLCGEQCVCYRCQKEKFSLIDTSSKRKPQFVIAHDRRERAKKFNVTADTILMQIPACRHIFTLNQLDRYMQDADTSSSAYIRCPICPAVIQGIIRYNADYKRRAETRENLKENLIKSSTISEDHIQWLKESQMLVQDFCDVDKGNFLSKPDHIDSNLGLALTMQMRFAYCLKEIHFIHVEMNSEMNDFKVEEWKFAVTAIQKSMPFQLQKEMSQELMRLLLREQLFILGKLVKELHLTLTDDVKSGCRSILKDTSKQKLTGELRTKGQSLIDQLYGVLRDSEKATALKAVVTSVEEILARPQTEDLCVILSNIRSSPT